MIRNLKAVWLLPVALFAIGAVSATAASASDVVTVGKSPALVTGVGHDHVLRLEPNGTSFSCTTARFAATVENGGGATVEAEYSGTLNQTPHEAHHCSSSTGTATIDMSGCGYTLSGETTGELVAGGGKDATVWITCPGANKIQVTSSTGATLSFGSQTPTKGGVSYTNLASHEGSSAIRVNATVTGVTYTCAPTFSCTLSGMPHHGNNMEYTGTVSLTAYTDSEGLPTPVTEGPRTALAVSEGPM